MSQEIDGQIVRGTINGYERFLRSAIWRDMTEELKVWKQLIESEYRDAKNMEEVARIQGRAEAIEEMESLPNRLLDALNASADNN